MPLGYGRDAGDDYLRYSLEGVADPDNGPGTVYVMKPFDGGIATAGNGMMAAFRATEPEMVQALHAACIGAGGADEGAPDTRSYYSDDFYIAYLRDPVGNKVAVFTVLKKESFIEFLRSFPGGVELDRNGSPSRDIDV